ncbi:MAG: hypothetical protein ABIG20_02110 [archaeon]
MTGNKGQGLSINMLVVIALAVFVIFLVFGFLTGGWSYFAGAFGGLTQQGEMDIARSKCQTDCTLYITQGRPLIDENDADDYWNKKLLQTRNDVDTNGDGIVDQSDKSYSCRTGLNPMMSASECAIRTS